MTEPIVPAPPPGAPFPVYPLPPGAYVQMAGGRREPERGLDGLLIAAWVLSMLGLALVVVGLALASVEFAAAELGVDAPDFVVAVALAMIGAILVIAGLSAASIRSIILRRNLGEDRYRGPSVLALLAIWIVASNLISIPFLGDLLEAVQGSGPPASPVAFVALVITPLTLLAITIIFVLLPRALPRVRLFDRGLGSAAWNFVLGVLIGGPAWLVGTIIAIAVSALLTGGLGLSPDSVVPIDLLEAVDPVLLVFALVVAAPVAEELFFRVVVFNAWEREYGFWRALIGSSAIFAAIHLSLFAFAPILLLAFVLGYVYARTRSLLTVIAVHATFNAISTFIFFTSDFV